MLNIFRANFAKSADAENIAPLPAKATTTTDTTTRPRTGLLQAAARRRRARASGVPSSSNPSHSIEQAAKKSRAQSKSPAPSTSRLAITSASPQAVHVDIEMSDGTQKSLPRLVTLPVKLARPDYKEVSIEKLAAIETVLEGVHVDYIRDQLAPFGPGMMQTIKSVKSDELKPNVLPRELAVTVSDLTGDPPTHMLAVMSSLPSPPSGSKDSTTSRCQVTLYAAHDLFLAAHCANLPHIPRGIGSAIKSEDGSLKITVPVVPFRLPFPIAFPALMQYIYTNDLNIVYSCLFPPASVPRSYINLFDDSTAASLRLDFAKQLVDTYKPQVLLRRVLAIIGFWKNVCILGIFDQDLWHTLDVAWEVVLLALCISAGDTAAVRSLVGEERAKEVL